MIDLMITTLYATRVSSPVGDIEITCTDVGLCGVRYLDDDKGNQQDDHDHLRACAKQLAEYFDGNRKAFDSLTLRFAATDFQRDVWEMLIDVPFGESVTYAELAKAAGHNGAARAVGTAMRVNPLAIIVPCHRVLPETGGTGEYAGGAWRKEWLLKHEGR